jgi:hypothetical protein
MEVIFWYFLGNRENEGTESGHPVIRRESNLASPFTIYGPYRHGKIFGVGGDQGPEPRLRMHCSH